MQNLNITNLIRMNIDLLSINGLDNEPKKTQFHDLDTEELYELNKATRQDELDAYGWTEMPNGEYPWNPDNPLRSDTISLSYRFNTHGFRGNDFPPTMTPRSVITLGCSFTFGVGMPEGLIWPTLVSTALQYRAINLASPAATLDDNFKYLLGWLPKLKSQHVFCLEPMRHENITDTDYTVNREKNILAMKEICRRFNSTFTFIGSDWYDTANMELLMTNGKLDKGRDLLSPGRKQHAYITYLMLKQIGKVE